MNGRERRYDVARFIHNLEPDYQKVHLEIPDDFFEKILTKLSRLYGKVTAKEYLPELERICRVYYAYKSEEMIELTKTLDPKNLFTEEHRTPWRFRSDRCSRYRSIRHRSRSSRNQTAGSESDSPLWRN